MQRILIRHLTGARANQIDEIPVGNASEILVGRDPEAPVRFDASRDDLVSRQHLKIVSNPGEPKTYKVIDLQSRNGSFLNRQRIYGSAALSHNDVIQLGPGGPEFRFELDPPPIAGVTQLRPSNISAPPTRIAMPPTREVLPLSAGFDSPQRPVGRATVERIMGDTFARVTRESNKAVLVGTAALAAIVVVGGGSLLYMRHTSAETYAQTQQSQRLIKDMGQAVKKAPETTESMRQAVIRLQEELKASERRGEKNLIVLEQQLAAQKIALERRAQQNPQDQPNTRLVASDNPNSSQRQTEGSVTAQTAQQVNYDSTVLRGNELLRGGNIEGAMDLARGLIEAAPNRWEGYSLAGDVEFVRGQFDRARVQYQTARSLAPANASSVVDNKIQRVEREIQQMAVAPKGR